MQQSPIELATYAVEAAAVVAAFQVVQSPLVTAATKALVIAPLAVLLSANVVPADWDVVQRPLALVGRGFALPYELLRTGSAPLDAALLAALPAALAYAAYALVGGWQGLALALPPLLIAAALVDSAVLRPRRDEPAPSMESEFPANPADGFEG